MFLIADFAHELTETAIRGSTFETLPAICRYIGKRRSAGLETGVDPAGDDNVLAGDVGRVLGAQERDDTADLIRDTEPR